MYEYKKGFTLVEVLLVIVLIIAIFSMATSMLTSFSRPNQKYVEKDFDDIRSILGQVKYLKFLGEGNVSIDCSNGKIKLLVDNQIFDEKQLKTLTCESDMRFSSASSTFEVKINQYGYVLFQRI